MADTIPSRDNGSGGLFAEPKKQPRELPVVPLAIAAGVVVLLVGLLIFLAHGKRTSASNQELPADPYASSLSVSDVKMSESTSLSNGKDTYIDGTLTNRGGRTVTGITVQVIFRNDLNLAPQIETVPVMLIRSREPYVDIQPVSAAPLAPGTPADFRLIFENISSSWNQQLPEIRMVKVTAQ